MACTPHSFFLFSCLSPHIQSNIAIAIAVRNAVIAEENFVYDDIESFTKLFPKKSQSEVETALYTLAKMKYIYCAYGDDTVYSVIVLPEGKDYFSDEKPNAAKRFIINVIKFVSGRL